MILKRFSKTSNRDTQKARQHIEELEERIAELEAVLESIKAWARAYPLEIFPEPDLGQVAQVLNDAGITLDAVSASTIREVLREITEMIDKAQLAPRVDTEQE